MINIDVFSDEEAWTKRLKKKKLLSHLNEISIIDFDHSDVVRHPLVSKIVKAYSNHND